MARLSKVSPREIFSFQRPLLTQNGRSRINLMRFFELRFAGFTFFIFAILLAAGCAGSSDPRYFDYSGSDGCSPPNIGHRLGGDLDGLADNSLQGLRAIVDQQSSHCFKNWEFDLTESADGLVLLHDSTYENVPVFGPIYDKSSR